MRNLLKGTKRQKAVMLLQSTAHQLVKQRREETDPGKVISALLLSTNTFYYNEHRVKIVLAGLSGSLTFMYIPDLARSNSVF